MRLVVISAMLLAASTATAGPIVGLDGGVAVPLGEAAAPEGPGLTGRLGWGLDLEVAELTPEIGVGWYGTVLPQAGGRLTLGERTRPGVFGHVLLPLGDNLLPQPGWDAGVSLDVGRPRTLGWGLQLGAVALSPEDAKRAPALVAGAHLTLRL